MEDWKFNFIMRIRQLIISTDVVLSDDVIGFIACQAALESNFGTSYLAQHFHNLFGMKVPKKRLTVASPYKKGEHCKYSGDYTSVLDYLLWLSYNRINLVERTSVDAFKDFLVAKKYCPSAKYVDSVDAVYKIYCSIKKSVCYE